MIKGSIEERMEYEEYIHSLKDSIRYPFWPMYWESRKIIRYYWIKKAKEKREFESKEIQILHLMSLVDTAARIGGIVYAWFWEEYIPEIILTLPSLKAEWFVPVEDMAKTFMNVPTKVVETALINAKVPRDVIQKALAAQRNNNADTLIEQLSKIQLDDIFGAFKLIYTYEQQFKVFSEIETFDTTGERKLKYLISDSFETLNPNSPFETSVIVDKISGKYIELCYDEIYNNPEPYIFGLCIGIQIAKEISNDRLGSFDPIAEVIREISEEPEFQNICNRYVQFPRYEERCLTLLRKYIQWVNKNFGTNISDEELEINTFDIDDANLIKSSKSRHLEFPTRFINDVTPVHIYAQEREPILTELFKVYGGAFENMTCQDFLYLFGAVNKTPKTYSPPYYWRGEESTMKALLRVFYTQQPRLLKELILHESDKAIGATIHNWGKNKNKVAYQDIEKNIIGIIQRVAGKKLKEL